MNDQQENKVSMYLAVEQVVDENNAVWTGTVAFANAYSAFKNELDAIREKVDVQETITTGIRADKIGAQDAMIAQAMLVAGAVYAFASETDNQTLKDAVSFTASDLKYVRDTISAERATIIHDQANAIIASLVDYDVDAAVLLALSDLIDAFMALIAAPRVAITVRKGATSGLVDHIKDIDLILKERMDKLMQLYKSSAFEFYTLYFNARVIVGNTAGGGKPDDPTDPGTNNASIGGTVTEMVSSNPLENVEVTLNPSGIAVFTDIDGSYTHIGLAAGSYELQFKLAGYITQVVPVSLAEGEVLEVHAELEVEVV
jgi:hypothetical protein